MRIAKPEGSPEVFADSQGDIRDLALDPSGVYWVTRTSNTTSDIRVKGKTGDSVQQVVTNAFVVVFAVDSTSVYYLDCPRSSR
jgi:hypothetical protein